MAGISDLQKLARQVGLTYIADGAVDLSKETLSNTDYIKMVLEGELYAREKEAYNKRRRTGNLPHRTFSKERLNRGIAWHIEQLETMEWLDSSGDITIIGKCDTGKTSLAVHLGEKALQMGERIFYCNVDDFIQIMRRKDEVDKYHRKFRYMLSCSLIIIDDIMYVTISETDLPLFYRAVNFLREERSIIYITNRELSEWPEAVEDKHLMRTLIDRISNNSQLVRLG